MGKSKTYKIYTLGCKVNQYDSGSLKGGLNSFGFELVEQNANIAIVNTCAVTKTAIAKAHRMINKARKENPGAKIVVVGCWPQSKNKNIDYNVDLIWGVGETEKLADKIVRLGKKNMVQKKKISILPPGQARSRYFLKIQDGCEQFCSYCIIPYTRGRLKSRDEEEIMDEIREAIKVGYKEIVLCGIHLGLYGKENEKKKQLAGLLKEIVKIKGLGRIRLSSIEVTEAGNELINLIASTNKICSHLHIPLQSGNDKILKAMNRPYDVAGYLERIALMREQIPDIAVTTDVMVGFPGESDEYFKETYGFVKKIKFSRLHVFPFSAHERTLAGKMSGQVAHREKKERAAKMRRLGYRLTREYKEKFKGKTMAAAVERIEENKITAKTEYYFDVKAKKYKSGQKYKTGEIIGIKYT